MAGRVGVFKGVFPNNHTETFWIAFNTIYLTITAANNKNTYSSEFSIHYETFNEVIN